MHKVAVVAFPGVVPFDLATPCEVFGRSGHAVRVCGVEPEVDAGWFTLRAPWGLDAVAWADTVIIPGVASLDLPVSAELLDALREAAGRGARLASICTGAFVLAATGLLDGRAATTHWLACGELGRRHPAIRVDPNVLYVDEGQFLSSAGAAAGLDLCLHLVRRDLGAEVAAATARLSVMPLERAGGQAQFIEHTSPDSAGTLEPLLRWIEAHLDEDLEVPTLARRAGMSPRSFARHFRDQTGTTPARWVNGVRVRRAQHLLETTSLSVDQVAGRVGFGSASTLRERFTAVAGTPPLAWRRAFTSGAYEAPDGAGRQQPNAHSESSAEQDDAAPPRQNYG